MDKRIYDTHVEIKSLDTFLKRTKKAHMEREEEKKRFGNLGKVKKSAY